MGVIETSGSRFYLQKHVITSTLITELNIATVKSIEMKEKMDWRVHLFLFRHHIYTILGYYFYLSDNQQKEKR
jgi:hypothetical protein